MSIGQQLQQVGIDIEDAKEAVALGDALQRLHDNADFNLVITKGYFEAEASRVVLLKADPGMASDEQQKNVDKIITSIGGLYGYFHKIFHLAEQLGQSLLEDEATQSALLQEEMGEDEL